MKVLQCCSTELAAPGRHAAVLKRHTMWSLYIHVMDTVCCSAGLAALVRYTTGKLWICSIMLQVQKSKRKVLVTTVKWGRLTTCNCSIILHKVHFLDNTTLHFHISLTIPLILVMTELQKMIQNITVIKKLQSVNPENIAVNTAALKCM